MPEYSFTVVIDGDVDALLDDLFDAGCEDATFGAVDGVHYADFDRTAPTFSQAVASALTAIESVDALRVIRVEPDDLVAAAEDEPLHPTPHVDVNAVLHDFQSRIQTILGHRFLGMYLDGSLALGDFDPRSSDIDFVVVTDAALPGDLFVALRDMHARFDAGGSPWATEVEAIYIPREAIRRFDPARAHWPRIERGETLVMEHGDSGWVVHWYIVREHGMALAGPDPRTLIDPVTTYDLRRAMAAIADSWLEPARHDRGALGRRGTQTYMVKTLCRMLYTLDAGAVVSKPAAACWARTIAGGRWATLIERASAWRKDPTRQDTPGDDEINSTLALIEYTLERCRQNDYKP